MTVHFNNISSGEYTTVAWEFGDGATSSETSPSHTYAAPGEYLVTLKLTGGPDGSSDLLQQSLLVGTPPLQSHALFLPLVRNP